MKILYFFSLLLLVQQEYAMKRNYLDLTGTSVIQDIPISQPVSQALEKRPVNYVNIARKPQQKKQFVELRHAGLFEFFPIDVLKIIFIDIVKDNPHLKSTISSFRNMRVLNRWFNKIILNEEEYVYQNAMPPIVFAAFTGQENAFIFEKLLNKEQLYGRFLVGHHFKEYIPSYCAIHKNIKKLITFGANICKASEYKPIEFYLKPNNGLYFFYMHLAKNITSFITELSQKTIPTKLQTVFTKADANLDHHTLLKRLYNSFFFTIQAENYLHQLFDRSYNIPLELFSQLKKYKGNLLAYDTNGKTFLEKALAKKEQYANVIYTLLAFPEVQEYFNTHPEVMAHSPSFRLLFLND